MDTKTGFNHVYENIYFEARDRKCLAPQASVKPLLSQNGVRKRDVYRMYGIRVLTLATGLHPSCAFLEIFAICRTTLALHLSLFKKARIWRKDKVLSNCAQHSLAIQTASAFPCSFPRFCSCLLVSHFLAQRSWPGTHSAISEVKLQCGSVLRLLTSG